MVSIFCSSVALVELVAGADATSLVLSSLPGISDTKLLELRLLEYYGPYVCWPIRVLYFVPVSVARVSFLCISTWYQSLDCSQPSPPPLPSPSRHRPHGWPAPSPLLRRALPSSPSLLHGCVGRAPSSHARRDSGDGPHGRASRAAPSLRRIRRARSVAPPPVGLALMAGSLSPPPPSGGSGPARTRPRWHPSHAHPHPHEAVSHLCGGQKRYASRGASPLRRCNHRSRHGPLQHTLGCPLRLRGGSYSPHSGPAALWSSVTDCWLRGGGGGLAVARADAVAVARREVVVALSGHPSTTRGLAPFTCGPGRPRVPRPLAPPPLTRSSLPLHPRRHPRLLPSLSKVFCHSQGSDPAHVGALD
jgi:hypothetical protein